MTSNDHAALLREMAHDRAFEANLTKNEVIGLDSNHSVRQYFDRLNAEIAALLAGAEALEALPLAQEQAAKVWGLACERDELKVALQAKREAVEVAKVAKIELSAIRDNIDGFIEAGMLPPVITRPLLWKLEAALARLEGE